MVWYLTLTDDVIQAFDKASAELPEEDRQLYLKRVESSVTPPNLTSAVRTRDPPGLDSIPRARDVAEYALRLKAVLDPQALQDISTLLDHQELDDPKRALEELAMKGRTDYAAFRRHVILARSYLEAVLREHPRRPRSGVSDLNLRYLTALVQELFTPPAPEADQEPP